MQSQVYSNPDFQAESPPQRYAWRKPSNLPERVELIDRVTSQVVAVVEHVGRDWQWRRNTSQLVHGAPPSEGMQTSLEDAKQAVLNGLPDAPAEIQVRKPR
ncbi:hypothetical protein [Anatilimnocola floriformis]|uniref:hypothetical protein n=1 Tax=Anatilimnocola floriformis TaxID=2948575 RepID=UPI0020C579E9|nr:hypothetical protein [Anatilimnocola floriformis]